MRFVKPATFTGDTPWQAMDLAEIDGATVRLHWTDAPYIWHVNDGDEIFVVLDGLVDMHTRSDGEENITRMSVGDIFHAASGDEHVAHPVGAARILVVERKGSI